MKKKPKVLIAADPAAIPKIAQSLSEHELLATTSLKQAEELLKADGIDLFVVGVHFDDSRALEFINQVRLDGRHHATPIVVFRSQPSDHAEILKQTFQVMKTIRGVTEYLELDADDGEQLRASINRALVNSDNGNE